MIARLSSFKNESCLKIEDYYEYKKKYRLLVTKKLLLSLEDIR